MPRSSAAVPAPDSPLVLSAWQADVMRVPEECDLALLGGKGSGKSHVVAPLVLRHAEQLGARCRALYVRQSHSGAQEFTLKALDAFSAVYGKRLKFASREGFTFPGGGTLQIDQLAEPTDYQKYMGRNHTLIVCDEAGEYPDPALIDKLRASLRPPLGVRGRVVLIGNPGGPGHGWLLKRYVAGAEPWKPRLDPVSGRLTVWCPSTYRDNPTIDHADYLAQLTAACAGDPALLAAWAEGSFAVAKGSFFGSVIDESRNMVEPWSEIPIAYGEKWPTFLAMDFGSSAPAVVYVVARSPGAKVGERYFPRDSLVLVDELSTNWPDDLNKGLGWVVPKLAEAVKDLAAFWRVRSQGVADDACFARTGSGAGSIAEEFGREGVYFSPARKGDRITGWTRMRRLLADAGKPDVPGLYVSRRCSYWWQTVPFLPRDPRRPEDVDSRAADHGADACRYACMPPRVAVQEDMNEHL